jgi:hypothetical protein
MFGAGEFKDRMRHGQGKMQYENGNSFIGQWVRGARREGEVIATLSTGTYECVGHLPPLLCSAPLSFTQGSFTQGSPLRGCGLVSCGRVVCVR